MVHALQRARCPLICPSRGGQAQSEDGRCSSFERRLIPGCCGHLYFSNTLDIIMVLSDGRMTCRWRATIVWPLVLRVSLPCA
jgi:hypothetical protein